MSRLCACPPPRRQVRKPSESSRIRSQPTPRPRNSAGSPLNRVTVRTAPGTTVGTARRVVSARVTLDADDVGRFDRNNIQDTSPVSRAADSSDPHVICTTNTSQGAKWFPKRREKENKPQYRGRSMETAGRHHPHVPRRSRHGWPGAPSRFRLLQSVRPDDRLLDGITLVVHRPGTQRDVFLAGRM